MKSFKSFLNEADALRDKKIRDEATRVWNKFLRQLKTSDVYFMAAPHNDNDEPTMHINVGMLIREKNYEKLTLSFLFTQKRYGYGGLFHSFREQHYIRLIVHEPIELESISSGSINRSKISKKDFFNNIKNPKYLNLFVHEFVHLVDKIRIKKFDELPRGGTWGDEGTFQTDQKYFNSPHEFNAFFQQSAKEIDIRIKQIIKDVQQSIKKSVPISSIQYSLEAKFPSDPKNFIKYLPLSFDYEKMLDDKFKKKFIHRLYDYYQKVAIPQRNKLIQQLESVYDTSFQKALQNDTQEVIDILNYQIEMAQEAVQKRNETVIKMIRSNILDYFKDFMSFYKSIVQHRVYFQFSKSMVDPKKTDYRRELQNVWRQRIEGLGKKLVKVVNQF